MSRLAPLVLPLLLSIAACGRSDSDHPPATDFPSHGEPARTLLKSAGESPSPLRYTPTAGQSDPLAIFADITVTAGPPGSTIEMGFGMDLEATSAIEAVKPGGEFNQSMEIGEARVSLRGELASVGGSGGEVARALKGMKMAFDLDSQGRVLKVDLLEGSSSMVSQLGQMQAGLDQALQGGIIPFPVEPIGVGGRWESLSTIDSMGAKIRTVTGFTLSSLEGPRGRLELAMSGRAEAQTLKIPNVPGEVEVEFIDISSSGYILFDLSRPTAARLDLTVEMKMALHVRGERALMSMKALIRSNPRG